MEDLVQMLTHHLNGETEVIPFSSLIGKEVIIIEPYEKTITLGKRAQITERRSINMLALEFYQHIHGHDSFRTAKEGHGWCVRTDHLILTSLIDEEEIEEYLKEKIFSLTLKGTLRSREYEHMIKTLEYEKNNKNLYELKDIFFKDIE